MIANLTLNANRGITIRNLTQTFMRLTIGAHLVWNPCRNNKDEEFLRPTFKVSHLYSE